MPSLLTARPASVAMLLAGALSGRPLAPLGPGMIVDELLTCIVRLDGGRLVGEPDKIMRGGENVFRSRWRGSLVPVTDGVLL